MFVVVNDSSNGNSTITSSYVNIVNRLLWQFKIDKQIETVSDCSPSMFIVLWEHMTQQRIPGITRSPKSAEEHLNNMKRLVHEITTFITQHDSLAHYETTMSLVTAEKIYLTRDVATICSLIEIFRSVGEAIWRQLENSSIHDSSSSSSIFSRNPSGSNSTSRSSSSTSRKSSEVFLEEKRGTPLIPTLPTVSIERHSNGSSGSGSERSARKQNEEVKPIQFNNFVKEDTNDDKISKEELQDKLVSFLMKKRAEVATENANPIEDEEPTSPIRFSQGKKRVRSRTSSQQLEETQHHHSTSSAPTQTSTRLLDFGKKAKKNLEISIIREEKENEKPLLNAVNTEKLVQYADMKQKLISDMHQKAKSLETSLIRQHEKQDPVQSAHETYANALHEYVQEMIKNQRALDIQTKATIMNLEKNKKIEAIKYSKYQQEQQRVVKQLLVSRASQEETIIRKTFQEMNRLEKDRVILEKALLHQNHEANLQREKVKLDQMQQFYKTQSDLLKEQISTVRYERQLSEKALKFALEKWSKEIRDEGWNKLNQMRNKWMNEEEARYVRSMKLSRQ